MTPYHILIIDDEVEILNALSRLLRNPLYDIHCAQTASQALALANCTPVDLVICDYMLDPTVNGIQLLEKISKKREGVICILLTGYGDVKIAMEAINSIGLYKFILKPWDNDELVITIRRALEQRALILSNRLLRMELKGREDILGHLEREYPGITMVRRDDEGTIMVN